MICTSPKLLPNSGLSVACGVCMGCRLKKKRDWAIRIMNETKYYNDNSFVTLTYDDPCLPENNSLVKEHLQNFFKRLRKRLDKPLRYYAAGEYGDENNTRSRRKGKNPHYHIIMFGHDFRDFNNPVSEEEGRYLCLREINDSWQYGNTEAGGVTIDSAKYVANYITKKHVGRGTVVYEEDGRIPEFCLMSRGNKNKEKGIGSRFYYDYLKPFMYDGKTRFIEELEYKGHKVRIPKYYQDKNNKIKKLIPRCKLEKRDEKIKKDKEYYDKIIEKVKNRRRKENPYDLILEKNAQIERNLCAKKKLHSCSGL